jgi:CheY-like chemotaxis protein
MHSPRARRFASFAGIAGAYRARRDRDPGDDLLRITNNILDSSKLDADNMTFEQASFSPAALTNGVIGILGDRAMAKGLRLVVETDPALPAGVLGDVGRIRQVLINLVSNAIKFTPAAQVPNGQVPEGQVPSGQVPNGQVKVIARCIAIAAGLASIEWAVSDTGIGIAPDRIGSLFSEFMQADNSISRRFGGTGLGLAISKRLVTQMDGSINVESSPGLGTTFRVRLAFPLAEQPSEHKPRGTGAVAAFQAAVKQLGRTPRVLFAEDNSTNQFLARQLLKDLDLRLDMVGDGLEAVDAASRFVYDAICMDVQMPELDGLAATRQIRSLGGRLATIPIIALTANAFQEDMDLCFAAGMSQFVSKPVNRETLVAALTRALTENTEAETSPVLVAASQSHSVTSS